MKELKMKMRDLLEKYDHNCSEEGIAAILDEWAANKAAIIEKMKEHPQYVEGQYSIAMETKHSRRINYYEVATFLRWMSCQYEAGFSSKQEFVLTYIGERSERTVCKELVENIKDGFPEIHVHEGMKTSRLINKICAYYGINEKAGYNARFARCADALSPVEITRWTVISVNPLDYLTMSFGNSWASCHTIDKENKRDMPNSYHGRYCSGTLSYMLDSTSIVYYTVDSAYGGKEFWTQPKITRQMFHWNEDLLVQSRMYPQDNDGDETISNTSRAIVQEAIARMKNVPNLWKFKRGTSACEEVISSEGTHYRDYHYFETCTFSWLQDTRQQKYMKVGHRPICPSCGYEHYEEETLNCDGCKTHYCEACGCQIEGDVLWYCDDPYCTHCATTCNHCDSVVLKDDAYITADGDEVCYYCEDNYYTRCSCCEELYLNETTTYIDGYGLVCPDCLEEEGEFIYSEEFDGWMHIDDERLYAEEEEEIV